MDGNLFFIFIAIITILIFIIIILIDKLKEKCASYETLQNEYRKHTDDYDFVKRDLERCQEQIKVYEEKESSREK